MSEEIKIGDIVTLKSGSPRMTVNVLKENGFIECVHYPLASILETAVSSEERVHYQYQGYHSSAFFHKDALVKVG